jgi:hypothetical protein
MPTLDIFNDDAFSVVSMSEAINNVPAVPGRLGQMGLFSERGITTTHVSIESRNGVLVLIPPTPRGGPGVTIPKGNRNLRLIGVPHFEVDDAVMADEVQNIRAFGSESELETVQGMVVDRMAEHTANFDATMEHGRVGAVKGVVTYADGTTLNLFDQFGVTQEAEVDFNLDAASPAPGALRTAIWDVVALIRRNLNGAYMTRVHALVGDAFWRGLINHPEVEKLFINKLGAQSLLGDMSVGNGQTFDYAGVTFENYAGEVAGQPFIATDAAHFFPVGVNGLFRTVFAPADYMETVNTMGQRLYAKQWRMHNDKGVEIEMQTNVLSYCTRPKALIKGRRT